MKIVEMRTASLQSAQVEDGGWVLAAKRRGRLAFVRLKAPMTKEVSFNREDVYYVKRRAACLGFIKGGTIFYGVVVFDFLKRLLLTALVLLGVGYASGNPYAGAIWSALFYALVAWLSKDDDKLLLKKLERMLEDEGR